MFLSEGREALSTTLVRAAGKILLLLLSAPVGDSWEVESQHAVSLPHLCLLQCGLPLFDCHDLLRQEKYQGTQHTSHCIINRDNTGFLLKNDNGQSILADISIGLIFAGIIMIMAITIVKSASDSQTELSHDISPEENEVKDQSVRSRIYIFI